MGSSSNSNQAVCVHMFWRSGFVGRAVAGFSKITHTNFKHFCCRVYIERCLWQSWNVCVTIQIWWSEVDVEVEVTPMFFTRWKCLFLIFFLPLYHSLLVSAGCQREFVCFMVRTIRNWSEHVWGMAHFLKTHTSLPVPSHCSTREHHHQDSHGKDHGWEENRQLITKRTMRYH